MKKIAIIGAGGMGREVAALIRQINKASAQYQIVGFFDDDLSKASIIDDLPLLGTIDTLLAGSVFQGISLVVAIGNTHIKRKVLNRIKASHFEFPSLIHPLAYFADPDRIQIGEGCIIEAGCMLTTNIVLGSHCYLNLACTVGHDTKLADNVALMHAVNLGGEVTVEADVFVGSGATIINQIVIGQSAVIGAGAVVVEDVLARSTVAGVPAKILKKLL